MEIQPSLLLVHEIGGRAFPIGRVQNDELLQAAIVEVDASRKRAAAERKRALSRAKRRNAPVAIR